MTSRPFSKLNGLTILMIIFPILNTHPSFGTLLKRSYLRGHIISYTNLKRKQAYKHFQTLHRQVLQTQHKHAAHPSTHTHQAYMEAKQTLYSFIQGQANWLTKLDQNRYYRQANKPGRLMAHLSKPRGKYKGDYVVGTFHFLHLSLYLGHTDHQCLLLW